MTHAITNMYHFCFSRSTAKNSVTLSISSSKAVEKVTSSPSDTENTNIWIIIGVVIPLLVVIVIISILYWKLCRTDKLEFQPDAMTSIQQRQKVESHQCCTVSDQGVIVSAFQSHFSSTGLSSAVIFEICKMAVIATMVAAVTLIVKKEKSLLLLSL